MNSNKLAYFVFFGLLAVAVLSVARPHQSFRVEHSSGNAAVNSQSPMALSEMHAIQQKLLSEQQPTNLLRLMPARYNQLRTALEGYQRTGVPLVASDGNSFYGAGFSDDGGIYYLIPKLASFLDLTLSTAIDVFFGTILCVSFLFGFVGFLFLFRSWLSRIVALIALLLLFLVSLREGDVYILLSSTAVVLVPWLLFFVQRGVLDSWFAGFALGAGLFSGFANIIRSHAATGFMLFMTIVVLFALRCPRRLRFLLIGMTLAGLAVPNLYFLTLRESRDTYLDVVQPDRAPIREQHPFWHPVYIGFGFLRNDLVPAYLDEVAAEKVASISPTAHYLSAEYEAILRKEVFSLIRHHFTFVVLTLAAKAGVTCAFLLLSANVGLLAAALYPKSWPIEVAFWGAIAFNSLIGLLVIPNPNYLLGFIAFGTLYAVVSINHALAARAGGRIERLPSRSWLRREACAG